MLKRWGVTGFDSRDRVWALRSGSVHYQRPRKPDAARYFRLDPWEPGSPVFFPGMRRGQEHLSLPPELCGFSDWINHCYSMVLVAQPDIASLTLFRVSKRNIAAEYTTSGPHPVTGMPSFVAHPHNLRLIPNDVYRTLFPDHGPGTT